MSNGVKGSDRPAEKVCDVEGCNAWKSGDFDKCHHHKGVNGDGSSHKHNQNAQKHGLFALPEHLKHELDREKEDRYTAYFEALCSRYERIHAREPDAFAKDRLSRVAIECVKERIADEYLTQNAESTILTQRDVREVDGRTVMVEKENHILSELTALKRETRLTLKDMGMLRDPESKKAEAAERTLNAILSESDK